MVPIKSVSGFLLSLVLFCLAHQSRAQITCIPAFIKEFTGAGQTEARAVKAFPDGSSLVAGRATATATTTNYDGYVTKLSATGAIQWAFLIGGSGNDIFTGISLVNDGGAILYGSTASFGHPESKAWMVRIDAGGAVVWSRQLGSGNAGTDRIKAIRQYTDGDLVGTFNTNDSSSASDPIVFKMGLDGSTRWARRFDNGNDDSFTSIAFSGDTLYAGGYYTLSGTKRAVITRIHAGDGSVISSRNIYRPDFSQQQEISGLEVYNQQISYGLWVYKNLSSDFGFNYIILVQTDLSDHTQFVLSADNGGDSSSLLPVRTSTDGFFILRPYKGSLGAPSVVGINKYGSAQLGLSMTIYYYNEYSPGFDIMPDGGFIATGFYNTYVSNYRNMMHIVRADSRGRIPLGCSNGGPGMFTDTLGYKEQPFQWSAGDGLLPGLDEAVSPAGAVFTPVLSSGCDTSYCIDQTPLPPGCNKTSRIEYGEGPMSVLRDAASTADGGRVAVGDLGGDGLVLKTQQNGDVAWSKSFEEFSRNLSLRRVLSTTDGNYFVLGNDAFVINHGANEDILLMKLDNSGNTLWSKNISMSDYGFEEQVDDIAATPDGGFVMVENGDYGSGGTYAFVLRFDASGNLVWKKNVVTSVETPLFRSIVCTQGAVFILSDTYDSYNADKFGVDKLDLATGAQVWVKRYSIGAGGVVRANRVLAIQDTAYVFLYRYTPVTMFNTLQTNLMVKLDLQGNPVQSLSLQGDPILQPNYYMSYLDVTPPTVTATPDQDFVFCQAVQSGTDSIVNLTRVGRDGTVRWSHNLTGMRLYKPFNIQPQGKGFITLGSIGTSYSISASYNKSFIVKLDSSGQLQTGASADCQAVDRPYTVAPYASVTLATTNGTETIADHNHGKILAATVLSQDVPFDATLLCYNPANCNAVNLEQKGKVCSLADTMVYYLDNSANCGAAATWNYDASYFRATQVTGDSIRLVPLKAGASTISARIEGYCSLNTQQMPVSIVLSSTPVNLGPDTLLCKNSQIALHAGPGYSSYRWNDNSTDSVLRVSVPGKYYVTTTDLCGNDHSDTVVVNPANFIFHLAGDTIRCNNEMVLLQASNGYFNYQWSPAYQITSNGDSALVAPDVATRYFASAQKWPGCVLTDSLLVTPMSSPAILLPSDTSLCQGDSLLLDAGPAFNRYRWSNGDSSQQMYVKQAGAYAIAAFYSNGCTSRDTFHLLSLYKNPRPNLDKNPVLCTGTIRQLDAGAGYTQYLWNDGSTGSIYSATQTGTYWVKVTDGHGCTGSDTDHILTIAPLPAGFLPKDTTICQYGDLVLHTLQPYPGYSWSNLSGGSSLTVRTPGLYWVEVTDNNGCTGRDSVVVTQKTCLLGLFVPNAFTPDNNGHNDRFRALLYGNAAHFEFAVYGRWGERIFVTQNPSEGWDGNIKGISAPAGTYAWYCRYQLTGQPEKLEKGTVILIR